MRQEHINMLMAHGEKKMIGRDNSDIYVAACGRPYPTRDQGTEHEYTCPECRAAIAGFLSPPRGHDGPCVSLGAWCPDCDCNQKHIRISEFAIECCECGEISETTEP